MSTESMDTESMDTVSMDPDTDTAAPAGTVAGAGEDTATDGLAGEAEEAAAVDELLDLGLEDPAALRSALEAVLFVADTPLPSAQLAAALRRPEPDVVAALHELGATLDDRNAGIELRDVAGGYRLYTRTEFAPAVEQYLRDGQRSKLTQAALETLAVIAYRQPVTRGTGLGHPWRQRGRCGPYPGEQRVDHRSGRRSGNRCRSVRHDRAVPGEARPLRPRRAALARTLVARRRRPRRGRWIGPRCLLITRPRPAGRPTTARPPGLPAPRRGGPNLRRRASGCRRCWPRPASAPAAPARS